MLSTIQAGRALAAVAVTAFHLSIMMGEPRYGGVAVFQGLTARWNMGVDFFFVLSGFIILHAHASQLGKPGAVGDYAWRRFARLFPVYWLYAALFALLVLVGVGGNSAMPSNLPETLTAVTLLRFSPEVSPLPVAWTLIHELAFYTLFGLMVWKFRVGLLVLAAWAALCLAVFHYPWEGEITAWQSYTAACNLYFLFGMGAWLLYRQAGTGLYEASLGVGVCCVGAWAFDMELRHAPLVMVTGFALLIAGAAKLERAGWLRAPRALAFTGDASYSLYLLHLPFSGVLLKLAVKGGALQALGHETTYLLVLAGTVALSCAAYVLVERPLVRRLRDRPWKGERSSAVLPATVQSA